MLDCIPLPSLDRFRPVPGEGCSGRRAPSLVERNDESHLSFIGEGLAAIGLVGGGPNISWKGEQGKAAADPRPFLSRRVRKGELLWLRTGPM